MKLIRSLVMAGLLGLGMSTQAVVTFFSDNMENGTNGWSVTSYGTWRQDQTWSSSGTTSWHFDTTPADAVVGNTWGYITTPSIAITNVTTAQLQFNQSMTGDGEWPLDDDVATVEISDDGGITWQNPYYTFMEGNPTETIDLSDYIGETIQIRFGMALYPYCLECSDPETESSFATTWHLDDVTVTGTP